MQLNSNAQYAAFKAAVHNPTITGQIINCENNATHFGVMLSEYVAKIFRIESELIAYDRRQT